jgi:hypothetical protein
MYQIASQFTNQDTSIYRANKLILLAQKKRISLACAAEDLKVDAVNSELHEVNYQISQLDGKYTFHVIEDTKKEVEFTIAGTKKMNNVVAPFIGYSWRVKKTNTNLKKTSNRRVRLLELNPEGENATMVMFDGIDTLRFSNLEMRRLESIKFQEPYNPSEAVVEYEILVEERERLREDLQHQREALVLLRDSLVRERDWKLSETCDLTTDLIRFVGKDFTPVSCMKCVWEANLPYMSPAERSMTFETWLKHFDASKEKMSARLDSLLDTRNFRTQLDSINAFDAKYPGIFLYSPQNCGFKINEDKYELVQNTNTGKSRSTKSYDVSGLMKSFFISQPGVYNCDQVSRLKNPVLVDAEYTNGKGENFLPTRIYYLDKAAGLLLAYDGYYNLGPAHFAVSPSSDYIILAFDHESNLYKACKSDTRITKLADGSTNLQVHLTEVTKGEFEKHDKNELLSSK